MQPIPAAPLDPRSMLVQSLLNQMGKGDNAPKSGMAVGSDLLAQALDQYALGKRQNQIQQNAYGQQLGGDFNALQKANQTFANGFQGTGGASPSIFTPGM